METERQPRLLYKIVEAAQITGYSRSFIYQAINKGDLKVIRKGKTVRVGADELHEWINEQGTESPRYAHQVRHPIVSSSPVSGPRMVRYATLLAQV